MSDEIIPTPKEIDRSERALLPQALEPAIPRPIAEYHEDMGPVLWWWWEEAGNELPGRWAGEPPYVGTPNDLGFTVQIDLAACVRTYADPAGAENEYTITRDVGGWPGYHTHFTPIPIPQEPANA